MTTIDSSGIYAIRHSASGRTYVGHSVNIRERWFQHRSLLRRGLHNNPRLQRAWTKHGESAFEFVVLEAPVDVARLAEREQACLDASQPNVYNVGACAHGVWLGIARGPISAEAKAKLRAATLGKPKPWLRGRKRQHSPETRDAQRAAALRRDKPDTAARRAMSDAAKRRGNCTSFAARSVSHKGLRHSAAHRAAIAAAILEHWKRRKAVA